MEAAITIDGKLAGVVVRKTYLGGIAAGMDDEVVFEFLLAVSASYSMRYTCVQYKIDVWVEILVGDRPVGRDVRYAIGALWQIVIGVVFLYITRLDRWIWVGPDKSDIDTVE